jgi:predicted 3-demethylubiquinone-9 3-methyltransferase (glyoxalase superfamily)
MTKIFKMNNDMFPCIWFNNQAVEAAKFYADVFKDVALLNQNPVVTKISIGGCPLMLLNGGPHFKPNPTISFYVVFEEETELDHAWEHLSANGKVMMPVDKYDWSDKYAWVEDQYGVSWQITLGKISDMGQKLTPALMYVGDQFGNAETAINQYISIFKDSQIIMLARYDEADELQGGKIKHGQFNLSGQRFIAMDSGLMHGIEFSEGISLVVICRNQEEVDHFWSKLTEGGHESRCGWLKDKYGVSWQVVPGVLDQLMSDPERAGRVTEAFMKMKKFDIAALLEA